MTPTRDIADDIALAHRLADTAWAAISPHFRNLAAVDHKSGAPGSGFDPVTEADRAAELAMRALISAERPEDGVTGEEFPETASASGWRWYFDPIDGTRAFVAGLPVWTTLIALVNPEGTPVLGVIDQPVVSERYIGWPGGAEMKTAKGTAPIRVSGNPDLRAATIATTTEFISVAATVSISAAISIAAAIAVTTAASVAITLSTTIPSILPHCPLS